MRRAKKKEQKKAQAEVDIDPRFQFLTLCFTDNSLQNGSNKPETNVEVHQTATEDAAQSASELDVKQPPAEDRMVVDGPVDIEIDFEDPAFESYKGVFEKFGSFGDDQVAREANAGNKGEVFFDGDDDIPSEDEEANQNKLSKKKQKKLNKLSIAELKALVQNPEVVEWQDPSSSDPRLLVQIKAQRNIVPVPAHWSMKREYLSSKRGIEKPPFKLPKFIADTGITEMRDAVLEKQAEQTLKQKQRERVQPKMGKLDIDYQKLYDAFFRHQTKPDLTRFGDVYYEGKELEADYKVFKPGELSDALKEALGIQPGFPPPWLLNQQRTGTPPSYPTLKIPGLNAPLPPGANWGFSPGQWGKPPIDDYNRPLYGGDIFGIMAGQAVPAAFQQQPAAAAAPLAPAAMAEPIDRTLWGELQPPAEESEEEEEESEEEEEEDEDIPPGGMDTSGLETPSGYASSMHPESGIETSIGEMDLRKTRRGFETEESSYGPPRSAYQVIPERQGRSEGFFGSDKTYDLSKQHAHHSGAPVLGQEDDSRKRKKPGDVEVALDPDALMSQGGIDKDELRKQYEAGRRQEGPGAQWANFGEDLSDMIAQESRKRQKMDEQRNERKKDKSRH